MVSHRLPQRGVHGVVVDDQDFEILVVQPRQRIERQLHHLGRLIADRQVHADLRLPLAGGEGHDHRVAAPLGAEHRLGQLKAIGEQQEKQQKLTGGEAALLTALARKPNEVLTREEIAAALGMDDSGERAIDVQVTRLRRKIETDPREPRFLHTVRGRGYVLKPGR